MFYACKNTTFCESKMQTLLITYFLCFKNVFVICLFSMFINVVWQRLLDVVYADWEIMFQIGVSDTLIRRLIICVNNVRGRLCLRCLLYVDTTWYLRSGTYCKEVTIVRFLIPIPICFMHVSIPRFARVKHKHC